MMNDELKCKEFQINDDSMNATTARTLNNIFVRLVVAIIILAHSKLQCERMNEWKCRK